MNQKGKEILIVIVAMIIGLYFLFNGLILAKSFLAPLTLAIILSMVMLPLSTKLEKWKISRGWSSFLSVIILFICFIGLFFLIAVEINNVSQDWPKIEKEIKPKIIQYQEYIADKTGISVKDQQKMLNNVMPGTSEQSKSTTDKNSNNDVESSDAEGKKNDGKQDNSSSEEEGGKENSSESTASPGNSSGENTTEESGVSSGVAGTVGTSILNFFSFIGTSLLTLIYIFFLLLYRNKIKRTILKFTSGENDEKTKIILSESIKLSLNYLVGRLLLILFLAIIYYIGLSISGVNHALIISIIAALLSLIPYIGNMIGFFLAMAMGAFSGGDISVFIGISITFGIAQFIESYILEPYIVGHKVELNPLVTILVVVLGGAVWGVIGMIISIPIFGILKIIFDRIPVLNPLGYALGEEDISSGDDENIFKKLYNKIKK